MHVDHVGNAGTKPIPMTAAQREAMRFKHLQADNGLSWQGFLESAAPTFGCDNAITVFWCGMWLCIEVDGYCHS